MTKREQILALVALKRTTKEISAELQIPEGTIRYYREKSKNQGQSAARISEHRRKLKRKAIVYSGGRCLRCGYSRSLAALEFHHLDPTQKEIGLANGKTWGWEAMKDELDKTVILCGNCHAELHEGLWEPDHRMIENQVAIRIAYEDQPLSYYEDVEKS